MGRLDCAEKLPPIKAKALGQKRCRLAAASGQKNLNSGASFPFLHSNLFEQDVCGHKREDGRWPVVRACVRGTACVWVSVCVSVFLWLLAGERMSERESLKKSLSSHKCPGSSFLHDKGLRLLDKNVMINFEPSWERSWERKTFASILFKNWDFNTSGRKSKD